MVTEIFAKITWHILGCLIVPNYVQIISEIHVAAVDLIHKLEKEFQTGRSYIRWHTWKWHCDEI